MITSLNACGRQIEDPNRSLLDRKMERVKRMKQSESDRKVLLPGDQNVQESICRGFYSTKDDADISSECKRCINKVAEDDIDCSCVWEKGNFCKYATCVESEYEKYNRCINTYNSIFNLDDLKDANFTAAFSSNELKNCTKVTNEKFDGERIENNSSNASSSRPFLSKMNTDRIVLVCIMIAISLFFLCSSSRSKRRWYFFM